MGKKNGRNFIFIFSVGIYKNFLLKKPCRQIKYMFILVIKFWKKMEYKSDIQIIIGKNR